MFGLDNLMDLLFDSAMESLGRNERVIKLLKRLNLDPEHPPEDFTGVYQYALVEYGVSKPRPVLEIFRQSEIQQLFREALEQNDPAKLLNRGEAFLAEHSLQTELQAQNIDVRREFYEFASVFITVAKRTRTPAELLANQKLESLHRQLGSLQERLNRLPTLEGMRTEMARLAGQDPLALPGATAFSADRCQAFALAQQIRGWFETLGFRFETHEIWQADDFEWIINVPVRRGRYDRILVRGMDGEAGLRDVEVLRRSVETHRTDEGWLVTARRISRAAREAVEQAENASLGCFTLDELLDQDADFSGYLDWLEAEIQQRHIDQTYVPLACTKEDIDPDTRQRLGVSRYGDRDGWIDGYIDLWLDDPAKEHISVLGEFGTGKTWFALHYAWEALQRYREAKRRGLERPRLPLVVPLRDYAKAVSVESLFSEFFFRKHEIPIPGYSAFEQLNRMGKLLLIFDGFDEMAARVDRQQMINNFWELAKVVVPGSKVILTCRTEHFPEAKEGRALLNAELQASTKDLTGETPQFEVLELEKFNDEQIQQVLSHQAQPATVAQIMGNPELLDLARRPVLTELILEALPDIEAGKPVDMSRVYLYAVRHKMERDIKAERTFTSMADKLYFMCELSWEMLSTDRMSINYREFPDRIRKLFGAAVEEEKDLDHWHYDMMGQTMLVRNAEGDYTPAHRSLVEFFVAYKFAAELGTLPAEFLELSQTKSNCNPGSEAQLYTWSNYFCFTTDITQRTIALPPLRAFTSEPIELLGLTIGKAPLDKAVIDLLLPILQPFEMQSQHLLLEVLKSTRNKDKKVVAYAGGNIVKLLKNLNRNSLSNQDLSSTVIQGGDFVDTNLNNTNFKNSILSQSLFSHTFSSIFSLAYSPDGKFLATAGASRTVDIWSTHNDQLVKRLRGHKNWIRAIVFSSDNKFIISASFDQTIRVWNLDSEREIKILKGHSSRINTVSVSDDSRYIASGSDDCTIRVWDFSSGDCLRILEGHTSAIETIVIHAAENLLISGSSDKLIRIWDLETGSYIDELKGSASKVRSIALSPDGKTLASGARDQMIRLWDLKSRKCFATLEGHTDSKISSVAFNYDGNFLASGCYDQTIKLWNLEKHECMQTFSGHNDWVRMVAFHPSGKFITSVSDDQTIRKWDIETGECLKTLQGYMGEIRSISLSQDDQFLAIGCEDKCLRIWKFTYPNNLLTPESYMVIDAHNSRINAVSISPTEKIVATASFDHLIKIWDLGTGNHLITLKGHEKCVNAIAFSPDGSQLVTTGADKSVRIWDVSSGKCINTLEGHENWLWSIAFSNDGTLIASAGDDQTVRFWNSKTGEFLKSVKEHIGGINSIVFSPDGSVLASAGADQSIKLWNVVSKECFKSWHAHESDIVCLAVSPNGKYLISSADENHIKVWDFHTQEYLRAFQGHTDRVRSIVFSSDGTKLISGSFDQTIRVWDVEGGGCLKIMRHIRPYERMNISGVKGLTDLDKLSLKALGAIED